MTDYTDYLERFESQQSPECAKLRNLRSLFEAIDDFMLKALNRANPPEVGFVERIESSAVRSSSDAFAVAYLHNTACLQAWERVYKMDQWQLYYDQAITMLNRTREAFEVYKSDECQKQLTHERDGLGERIEAKFCTLLRFDRAIPRRDGEDDRVPTPVDFAKAVEAFRSARIRAIKKKPVGNANRNSFLVLFTVSIIIVSLLLLMFSYPKLLKKHGSIYDADFLLLVQASIMQLFGLISSWLISLTPKSGRHQPFTWPINVIRAIAILGMVFVVAATVLYFVAPPIWNKIASCLASVMQAVIVLQLALFVDDHARTGHTYLKGNTIP